jgi:hypothetical protein
MYARRKIVAGTAQPAVVIAVVVGVLARAARWRLRHVLLVEGSDRVDVDEDPDPRVERLE